jgi:hypothetical protein
MLAAAWRPNVAMGFLFKLRDRGLRAIAERLRAG